MLNNEDENLSIINLVVKRVISRAFYMNGVSCRHVSWTQNWVPARWSGLLGVG